MTRRVQARRKPPATPKPLLTRISPAPKVDARHRLDAAGWADNGNWVNVSSSNVAAIMYRKFEKRLFVQFTNGGIYFYLEVPERVARDMFTSNSMGRYLHQRTKGKFAFVGPLATTPPERAGTLKEQRSRAEELAVKRTSRPNF